MACSFERASRIAKPPTSSFASVNGPSVTVILSPDFRTRAPSALGRHPSVEIRVPSFMLFSISFSIREISSRVGGTLRSTVLKIDRYRMTFLLRGPTWRSRPALGLGPVLLLRLRDTDVAEPLNLFAWKVEVFELEHLPHLDVAVLVEWIRKPA